MVKQWGGHSITAGQSVVLVVDNKAQRESVIEELKAQVQNNGTLTVLDNGTEWNGISNINGVILYGGVNVDNTLTNALKALKHGGFVALYLPLNGGNVSVEDVADKLMFAGFVNTKTSKLGEFYEISSSKPNWEVGASQKLNLKKPSTKDSSISLQDAKNIWTAKSATDDDLIDEDSLLDENDRNAKPQTTVDDCDIGKTGKKACKNCSCGRADEPVATKPVETPTVVVPAAPVVAAPAKPRLTKEMLENPGVGSNCGSCTLGDAFRCGGCPYRGLPAFKTGEKITIPDNYMADDI